MFVGYSRYHMWANIHIYMNVIGECGVECHWRMFVCCKNSILEVISISTCMALGNMV